MPLLKKLFWLYFLLLIFEGALRKWVLPGLSAPLLLVRDPVAMLIIVEAYRKNKWPERWSVVIGGLTCALVGLCVLQVTLGDNSWIAAVYGLRSYLLPFPVAFIMGENLDAEDLRKFGVATLWIMLPLVALEAAQYLAPQGSFLNAGAYKGAQQIYYAGEHVRASGTFSFVAGPTFYNADCGGVSFLWPDAREVRQEVVAMGRIVRTGSVCSGGRVPHSGGRISRCCGLRGNCRNVRSIAIHQGGQDSPPAPGRLFPNLAPAGFLCGLPDSPIAVN